jgi:preprotein translocase subunit Sss1
MNPDYIIPESEKLFVADRLFEVNSSVVINWLRLIGVIVFTGIQFINFYQYNSVSPKVHQVIIYILIFWGAISLSQFLFHSQKISHPSIKYLTTFTDTALLSMIIWSADGPRSSLIPIYIMLISVVGLYFNLRLLWFTIAINTLSYLGITYFSSYYQRPTAIEHSQILVFVAITFLTGGIVGQIIRLFRKLILKGDIREL